MSYLRLETPAAVKSETVSWAVPPWEASGSEKVAWVDSQIQEAEGWLEGQKSYKQLNRNLRVFDGLFNDKTKSSLITNELRYAVTKFVTTLAEVREIAEGYGYELRESGGKRSWHKKESLIKANGQGLSWPINTIEMHTLFIW